MSLLPPGCPHTIFPTWSLSFWCRPADVFFWPVVIDWLVLSSLQQFLDLIHFLHHLSHSECCFGRLVLGCLSLHMGFLRQSLGFVDLVLHQIQLRASLHCPVGMLFPLVGHQFLLYRFVGSSDLALIVADGPTQLTRISLSRAICPGLDQEVSVSLCWYPVVDSLGLLLQLLRLEIRWHWRGRLGGSCTRWIVLTSPKPRVSLSPRHPRCVAERTNGNLGTHAQPR